MYSISRFRSRYARNVIRLVLKVVGAKVRTTARNSTKSIARPNVKEAVALDQTRVIAVIHSVLLVVLAQHRPNVWHVVILMTTVYAGINVHR